jgi:hypothetical protein
MKQLLHLPGRPAFHKEMHMEYPTELNKQAANPTVHHPADPARFTEEHQAELSRLIEMPWRAQAEANAEIIKTEQQAHAPLLTLLAQSADAVAASKALSQLRVKAWAEKVGQVRTGVARFHSAPFVTTLFRPIGPGINVFSPPYDFEVRQPTTSGDSILSAPNRHEGTFSVGLGPGQGGARWATAGVGMVLQATVPGVAHVAPYWPFDYDWWIAGHLLSGHTRGGCRAVVQDAFTAGVLGPVGERSVEFWNHTSQTQAEGQSDGSVYGPDIEVTVALSAGQVFNVSFVATALVDDSEGSIFGWSMAGAGLRMRVPFFVVRMNIP